MGRGFESLLRHHKHPLVKRILALVPLSWLYAATAVCASLMSVVGWRRKLIDRHLERCLPDLDPPRRRAIARGFYTYLGQISAEFLHIPGMDGAERVLILSSHHCNWEWLLLRCSNAFSVPLTAAYKVTNHPRVDRAVRALREKFGGTMVPAKALVQHLLQQRGQVRLLAMLADQSPARDNEQCIWLEFFGQQTAFHSGPGWMGAKLGFHVVLANMQRRSRGRYSVRFVELAAPGVRADPEQWLRLYVQQLEQHVRTFPEQYVWAYNRWKREKPLYG